ncbi:MAG: nuclear transport factor 2 family protein, partial [Acidimicrobiaceae bacterium]|nr:nuclear transport factor 2 family protein [Acidimicrobiaceae bacterium]
PVLLDAGVDTAAARAPRAVVIGFLAAIAERNWTAARELLAAEVSWTLPGARSNGDEARTRSGRDDLEAFASRVRPLLDMERVRVESALPAGEVVYVPLHDRQRRTHRDQGNDEAAVLEVSTRDGRIVGVAVHGHLDGLVTLLTGGAE